MYTSLTTTRAPLSLNPYMGVSGIGDGSSGALIGGAISAGVGLATSAAALWMSSIQLSHNADTATTQIVNGLEPLLNNNKNAYLAGPGTCQDQAAALSAFDTAMQWLQSPKACGQMGYGSAGNRCITDRLCQTGCKFPWIAWYRDPIANDPRVAQCAAQLAADNPDAAQQSAIANIFNLTSGSVQQTNPGMFDTPVSTASAGSTDGSGLIGSSGIISGSIGGIPTGYLLIGGAVLLLVAMMD